MPKLLPKSFYRNDSPVSLYKKGFWGNDSAHLATLPSGSLFFVVKEDPEWSSRYIAIVNDQVGTIRCFCLDSLNDFVMIEEPVEDDA